MKKSIKILTSLIILGGICGGTYLYKKQYNLNQINNKGFILKVNSNLQFNKSSDKLISLNTNKECIIPPAIKEFAIKDSTMYLKQNPNKDFLEYTYKDGITVKLEENKLYYWVLNLECNEVSGIYTDEEFNDKFADIITELNFESIKA